MLWHGRFILREDNTRMVESYASVRQLIKAHRGVTGKPLARLSNGRLVKLTCEYIRPIKLLILVMLVFPLGLAFSKGRGDTVIHQSKRDLQLKKLDAD